MFTLSPRRIFLDEAGSIYLPLAGPGRSCLRLNASASKLWRRWIQGEPIDESTLSQAEQKFLKRLFAAEVVEVQELEKEKGL